MRLEVVDAERCVGCQSCMFACARRQDEVGLAKASLKFLARILALSGWQKTDFKRTLPIIDV